MPEGEAVGVQRLLCLWAPEARSEGGRPADWVDGRHVVKPPQVERDHGGEAFVVGPRAHATDDTRAAAERHDCDPVLGTHCEQGCDLTGTTRDDHGVGRVGPVAGAQPIQVRIALAPRVLDAPNPFEMNVIRSDEVGERLLSRRPGADLLQP
jgi:hypothetical protein